MKIAYILPNYCLIDGKNGGVRVQAMQWVEYMRLAGHEVVEVSPWDTYDWKSFDVIQYFYFGLNYVSVYKAIREKAPQAKFVCAPILDPHKSIMTYRILSFFALPKIKLWTEFSVLRFHKKLFDCFLARSFFEKKYLVEAFGIDEKKVFIVPLNSRLCCENVDVPLKELFCLHVSRLCDPTKSVERLVDAALKYDFKLVLAGSSSDDFDLKIKHKVGDSDKVVLLGRVSDDQLISLYSRAKVFALPSTREGVGLAALEAGSYGCDIVLTNIGGPKEYFLPNAIAVNPYDVDEIGLAIKKLLNGNSFQPELKTMIQHKYSKKKVMDMLDSVYKGL